MDLMPLYQATAKGELDEALAAQPDLIRDEVADQAHADFIGANEAGRTDIAYVAATTAAFIQLNLGQRDRALSDRLDAAQALFMLSEDPPAYDAARGEALQVGALALEIGDVGLILRSWVLASDCAWFACETSDNDEARLIQSLRDCADSLDWAGRLPDAGAQQGWLERLASLVAAVAGAGMGKVWSQEWLLEADALLRRLAAGSDHLPIDLGFDTTGGPTKTAEFSAMLSELESRYGAH